MLLVKHHKIIASFLTTFILSSFIFIPRNEKLSPMADSTSVAMTSTSVIDSLSSLTDIELTDMIISITNEHRAIGERMQDLSARMEAAQNEVGSPRQNLVDLTY